MVSRSSGLKLLISFFVVFSALLGVLSLTQTAHADGAAGPFLSQKLRDRVADYQQLTYTLSCIPTETMADKDVFGTGNGLNNVGAEDMVFASKTELNDWKVIDQNVFGASNNRGDMFDHEILTCDDQNEWGFRWPFVQFGRPDLVEVFCSTSGVYNSQTGGLGKTVNGGSDKAACQAGTKFGGSYFVAKQGTNLRKAVSDELSKKSDRAKEAANGLSPAEKYIQYWLTFQKACGVTLTSEYPKNGDPAGGDGSIYKVAVVNQNGDIVYYVGNTGGKSTDGKKVKLDASDQAYPGSTTCGQLAIGLRDLAPKYSAYLKGPGKNDAGVEGTGIPEDTDIYHPKDDGDGETTQCNIPKTGWILCPVLDTMANIGDQAFNFLSDNFLKVDTTLFDTSSGTHSAWKVFRDLANIAFVIAIFVVIYSQLTGAGLSNYGIKKLLPKIIVAAILVNLSYYICQLAVDISNILGYTLRDFFDGVAGKIKLPDGNIATATKDTGTSPLDWAGIVAAIVITGTLVWLFLGALIPVLLAALIAMFMILFILLARKALIVLLIALSPLAFVAYLLPNTEQWYKKWQKTFFQLLMVFPIIAVVFGASGLASKIVQASDQGVMMRIIAAGIAVIPLFVVPGLLKRSVDAAGNIGAKINGVGNKVGGWAGKKGSERFERSAIGRGRALRSQAKNQYRDRRFAERLNKGGVTGVLAGGAAGVLPRGLRTKGMQYQQDALGRSATGTAIKADREDVGFAEQQMTAAAYQHPEGTEAYLKGQFNEAVKSGDKVKARAALSALSKQGEGGVEAARAVIAGNNSTMGDTMRQSLQQHINENHSDLKGKDSRITNWAGNSEAGATADTSRGSAIQDTDYGGLTDAQIAGQTKASLSQARATGHLNDDDVDRILNNPDVSSELKRSKREVLDRSSSEQMDVIHQDAINEDQRRSNPGP